VVKEKEYLSAMIPLFFKNYPEETSEVDRSEGILEVPGRLTKLRQ
jgi:hypothetical protein